MVAGSAKKTPSKGSRSAAQVRRSASKALKSDGSPVKTPGARSAKKASREYNYTSRLPTEQQRRENGRVPGRNLIVWGRPRMAEKLLLHLQYECSRHKIELPWDSIAHRFHPGSTGAAVCQHLGRLRRELTAEGHLVPPMLQRPGISGAVDPNIRGFVRKDEQGEDKLATRPVRFSEKHDDRRFNLPDALDVQDHLPTASFEEEAESDGEDLLESPTPQQRRSQVPTGGLYQYTEQASPTQDYQHFEANEFKDSVFSVQYNGMDIDGNDKSETEDETIFTSPTARRHQNVVDPNFQASSQASMYTEFNAIPQIGTQEVTPQPFPMACPSSVQVPQSHDPATLSKSILQMNNIGAYQLSPWNMSNAAYQSPSLEALQTHMMFRGQMYPSTTSESSSDRPSAEESMLNEALASTGAHFNDFMIHHGADDLLPDIFSTMA